MTPHDAPERDATLGTRWLTAEPTATRWPTIIGRDGRGMSHSDAGCHGIHIARQIVMLRGDAPVSMMEQRWSQPDQLRILLAHAGDGTVSEAMRRHGDAERGLCPCDGAAVDIGVGEWPAAPRAPDMIVLSFADRLRPVLIEVAADERRQRGIEGLLVVAMILRLARGRT